MKEYKVFSKVFIKDLNIFDLDSDSLGNNILVFRDIHREFEFILFNFYLKSLLKSTAFTFRNNHLKLS